MIPDWLAHWLLNWLSLEPLLRRWNLAHYPLLGAHHARHSHSSMPRFFTGFPRPVPEGWCVGLISGSSSLSRTPEFWAQNYCGPTWAAHTVPAPRCWLTLACHFPQQPTTVPTVALGLNTISANSLLFSTLCPCCVPFGDSPYEALAILSPKFSPLYPWVSAQGLFPWGPVIHTLYILPHNRWL